MAWRTLAGSKPGQNSSGRVLFSGRLIMLEKFDPLKEEMLRILHPDGRLEAGLRPDLDDEVIRNLFKEILFVRLLDQKALSLQRQGRMGTYAPVQGQEAAQIGSAFALGKEDWVFPSFRETGVLYLRGVPVREILLYWMGDERGAKVPEDVFVFPISVPVGTHPLHALGAAWAAKLRRENICTIAYFGDGATSEGDFHEALNFSGVFRVPAIFFCQNNQYAISVPRRRQTASKTIAQKALAYGIGGVQIDGNDLLAAYAAVREAREKALAGGGPTLIEAVTYRFGPHTTADDPTKYREEKEIEEWRDLDPLIRLRKYLGGKGLWDEAAEKSYREEAEQRINGAVAEAEALPLPPVEDIFRYTYAEMTPDLKEQLSDYRAFLKEKES
jgi:pyruvate dehydrogenase E1 component alpha subunit